MNSMCQNCGFDIVIDDTQVPPYAFTVECPRCRKSVTISPPAKPEPVLKSDTPAARTQMIGSPPSSAPAQPADMMQAFMSMMAAAMAGGNSSPKVTEMLSKSFAWQRKHIMICCADQNHRVTIESVLDKNRYDTNVPQTSAQAIEFMQELKIDIVLLDPQFDAARQGGIAVLRHVSSLMPKYRRRIYVVLISPQVKTLDTYMAFLNCVNLTVNTDDLESLPIILEKSVKDYNELYKPLYEATGLSPF